MMSTRRVNQNNAEGICPFCGKLIEVEIEFRDELSKQEFALSGLCQSCQDDFFLAKKYNRRDIYGSR